MVDNDGPKLGGISIKNYRVKKCSEKHVHTKKYYSIRTYSLIISRECNFKNKKENGTI